MMDKPDLTEPLVCTITLFCAINTQNNSQLTDRVLLFRTYLVRSRQPWYYIRNLSPWSVFTILFRDTTNNLNL